jgi:signal transduction histidine kinase/streptogramin lyase
MLRTRIRLSSLIPAIVLFSAPAWALDPSLDVNQYAHTAWALRDGAFRGYPKSLAQTEDGYLLLGTEFGMVRFDGVRFVPREPPPGAHLPSNSVVKVLATRDGSLWIGTTRGLARWKDGELTHYPELAGHFVTVLVEVRQGTVLAGTSAGITGTARLCAIQRLGVRCDGADGGLGGSVLSLYEDTHGVLWVGAATGLWRWTPGAPTMYSTPDRLSEIHAITEDEHGSVLVALNRNIERLGNGTFEKLALPGAARALKPTALLRDRQGSLWIGTQNQGLFRLHQGRIDQFARTDGLSGDFVTTFLEDVEGDVWVATLNGLDRFRDVTVTTMSTKQGLSADTVLSVRASHDGSVWIGTVAGLNRWKDGAITRHPMPHALPHVGAASLFEDRRGRLWVSSPRGLVYFEPGRSTAVRVMADGHVHAIAEDRAESLWVSHQESGLIRLEHATVVESFRWATLGGKNARALAADPSDGGLWLGFFQGGLAYFKDGQVRLSYTVADGLGHGEVRHLRLDSDEALWVATEGGLSRLKNGAITTLTNKNGLPCAAIRWTIEDDSGALWLYSACALVRVDRSEVNAWVANPQRPLQITVYDSSDGVPSHSEVSSYSPTVARSTDGRIWFASHEGAMVVDPRRVPFNAVAPPVHIEQITADRKTYDVASQSVLPPLIRDLRIDYTALSLRAPEKVQFRYWLEGRDQDWVDARNRRQAFYTDLPPRSYRFHVIASNNDGVHNQQGAVWSFSIQPALYQTAGFRVAATLFVMIGCLALYRMRVARLARQLNLRFEERLAERTRIAQELHDTLLQSVLSASMQLHVFADQLEYPERSPLDHVLERLRQAAGEGRQTVQALRTHADVTDDLELALARDAESLRGQQAINIGAVLQGKRQPLRPVIRDDVYRIGREALANTFRHAGATRVEIELEYSVDGLRVCVRDDGCGMAPSIVEAGRPGHWGILGMRERAERIGATLTVLSAPSAGTEVELLVPGQIAFQHPHLRRKSGWFRRW